LVGGPKERVQRCYKVLSNRRMFLKPSFGTEKPSYASRREVKIGGFSNCPRAIWSTSWSSRSLTRSRKGEIPKGTSKGVGVEKKNIAMCRETTKNGGARSGWPLSVSKRQEGKRRPYSPICEPDRSPPGRRKLSNVHKLEMEMNHPGPDTPKGLSASGGNLG